MLGRCARLFGFSVYRAERGLPLDFFRYFISVDVFIVIATEQNTVPAQLLILATLLQFST